MRLVALDPGTVILALAFAFLLLGLADALLVAFLAWARRAR